MGLYDTFLGKFRFFHIFIQILLHFHYLINEWGNAHEELETELKKELADLKVKSDALYVGLEEAHQIIKVLQEKAPEKTFRNRTEIMDNFHAAINPTE